MSGHYAAPEKAASSHDATGRPKKFDLAPLQAGPSGERLTRAAVGPENLSVQFTIILPP
jgi:hypothetical protein